MPRESNNKDLSKLKEELALVQRGLELIKLIDEAEKTNTAADEEATNHEVTHPVGTEVKFTNPRERHQLRGKTAEVVGHSPKFVRVRRGKDVYHRHPNNLTPQK